MPAKKKPIEASWEKIGKLIGRKIEKELSSGKMPWKDCMIPHENHENGFVGRVLFIIGVLLLLNHLGVTAGVSIWIQILIGVGFALMRL
jgi:hypothetical protein